MSDTSKPFDLSKVTVHDLLDSDTDLNGPAAGTDEGTDQPKGPADSTPGADPNNQDEPGTTSGDNKPDTDDENADDAPDEGQDGEDEGQDGDGSDEGEGDGSDEGGDGDDSVISEISELLGFEVDGEFTEDVQGIAQYTKKVGEKIGEQYLASVFEQFPDVQKFLEFRARGGKPEDYMQVTQKELEYSAISEDQLKANVDLQKKAVRDMYSKMGWEAAEVDEIIKDLEDSELLLKQSVKSVDKLKKISAEEKAQLEEQQRIQAEAQARKDQETWKEISTTIAKGELKGMVVPEAEKRDFFDWMTKPIDNKGTTRRMVDMSKMDTESSLALEYLYYKQFNINNLKGGKTSKSQSQLRNRLKKSSGSPSNMMSKGKNTGHQRAAKLPGLDKIF